MGHPLTSRYDDAVDVTDPVIDLLEDLRPQPYAMVRTDRIANPIVEPQWGGVRVLAAVEDGSVALRDEAGEPFTERPEVDRALGGAVRARSAILDGYLTKQPTGEIVYTTPPPDVPSMTAFIAKPFIGIRRDRAQEKKEYDAQLAEVATFLDDDRVAFVAIDAPPARRRFAARRPAARAQAPARFGRDAVRPRPCRGLRAATAPDVDRDVAAARVRRAVLSRRQLPLPPGRGARRLDPRPDAPPLTHRREAATVAACPPRS